MHFSPNITRTVGPTFFLDFEDLAIGWYCTSKMPGLQNPPSKQETGSVHERKKDQSGNHAKIKQRIRVIYSDPDATDCSSDDGNEGWNKVRNCFDGAERLVKEVCIFTNREKSCYRGGNKLPTKGKDGYSTRPSKHPGVRRRPWGKWVAEIRDPFTGKKNWLGTFLTEDEAVSAYQKKKLEYENSLQKQGKNSSNIGNIAEVISETSNSEEIDTNVMTSLPSPSSVLDAPKTNNSLGAIPSFQNEAKNQDVPITTSVEEPVLSSSNFVYLGIDVEHFFDDIRVEDLPCCELNVVAVTDFPNIDFDISSSDIAWIDELINNSAL